MLRLTFAVSHFCNNVLPAGGDTFASASVRAFGVLPAADCTQQGGKLKCIREWSAGAVVCLLAKLRDEMFCHYANYEWDKRH